MWFGRGTLIINIGTVRKGLFLVGDLQNWVGELQIKWANCKSSGRIEKLSGRIEKLSGRIASHTPLRQLADFAPTTEPKNNWFSTK